VDCMALPVCEVLYLKFLGFDNGLRERVGRVAARCWARQTGMDADG
jgi:hypothetical protein